MCVNISNSFLTSSARSLALASAPTPMLSTPSGDKTYPNVLALGDVAETGGPKMGRAAAFQAEIVCQNIVSMAHNEQPRAIYHPNDAEGAIKLTLGKVSSDDWRLDM